MTICDVVIEIGRNIIKRCGAKKAILILKQSHSHIAICNSCGGMILRITDLIACFNGECKQDNKHHLADPDFIPKLDTCIVSHDCNLLPGDQFHHMEPPYFGGINGQP